MEGLTTDGRAEVQKKGKKNQSVNLDIEFDPALVG
jgi:hypothetical protein